MVHLRLSRTLAGPTLAVPGPGPALRGSARAAAQVPPTTLEPGRASEEGGARGAPRRIYEIGGGAAAWHDLD